jgi:hypothetical protein
MRVLRLFVIVLLLFGIGCDTDNSLGPQKFFVNYYGGDGDQIAVDMVPTSDGNYLILGDSDANDPSKDRVLLIKVDTHGNVVWEKKLATVNDTPKDIEIDNAGNFVILLDSENIPGDNDIKLIVVNPNGQKVDSIVYGSPGNDISKSVTSLTDGGYIVTGSTEFTEAVPKPGFPEDRSDIVINRFNSNLNIDPLWKSQYGPGNFDEGTEVLQFNGDEFYAFATTDKAILDKPPGKLRLIYYRLFQGGSGNVADSYLGNLDNDIRGACVINVPSVLGGGYFLTATETASTGSVSLHITKLRSPLLFNAVNDKQFDREIPINARKIVSLSGTACIVNQGYLVLGTEQRESETNIWLTKVDLNGNEVWSRTFGSDAGNDNGASVLELPDGRIFLLGTVELENNQSKIALLKLNSNGQLMD